MEGWSGREVGDTVRQVELSLVTHRPRWQTGKKGETEFLEDYYGMSDRLEGQTARPSGDCGGRFYVSTWLGYRIQLFNQTWVPLRRYFLVLINVHNQLTLSKGDNLSGPDSISWIFLEEAPPVDCSVRSCPSVSGVPFLMTCITNCGFASPALHNLLRQFLAVNPLLSISSWFSLVES